MLKIFGQMLKALAILAIMLASGIAAFTMALSFAMNMGLKYHDNYEYYGQFPVVFLIFGVGVLGLLAPAVVLFYLHNRQPPWQFSLRALLITMAVVALLLGIYALSL